MSDDLSGDMLAPSWPNLVTCCFFLDSMLFNKILCNFCFHYLTTSPTCSEAGGAGDLVSQLIYLRKSSCVVPSKKERQSFLGSLP